MFRIGRVLTISIFHRNRQHVLYFDRVIEEKFKETRKTPTICQLVRVHRAIQTTNEVVNNDGGVKIVDFFVGKVDKVPTFLPAKFMRLDTRFLGNHGIRSHPPEGQAYE